MDYDSASAARRAAAPSDVEVIRTAGYDKPGDGGGATYRRSDSQPRHAGWFRAADGGYWLYVPDARGVNAKAFGAVGDGVLDARTLRPAGGTNDAPAIQDAIDFAVYEARTAVYLPAGVYRIEDTLHLGYGAGGFESVTLEGDGADYRGQMSGTVLVADFSDRPALAVQGARMTRIRDLGLVGRNAGWILGQGLMGPSPQVDDTELASWIAPDLHANAASRYAPYAAVAIDPYSGAAPNPSYPQVRYPEFLGPTPQYGKAFSSNVVIENCYIGGFVVGVAIHPCDAAGNGDFIRMRSCSVELCAYVVSSGDGEGREVSAVQCTMALFHSGVVNTIHGRQHGQLDFTSDASSWESCIQIFDIGAASYSGPFTFRGGYSENIWRIGNWGWAGSELNSPLSIEGHLFHFTAQGAAGRGIPATVLDAAAPNPIALRNCHFANFSNVMMFGGEAAYYEVENCALYAQTHGRTLSEARPLVCDKLAHDALAGGVCFVPTLRGPSRPSSFSMGTALFDIDNNGAEGSVKVAEVARGKRGYPICAWSRQAEPLQTPGYAAPCPPRWTAYDKARPQVIAAASISASNGQLTAHFADLSVARQALFGPAPGDIILDAPSQTIFRVRSVTGTAPAVVIADIWTNHRIVAGACRVLRPFVADAGVFFVLNTRFYMPADYTQATFTAGSARLAKVGRADGDGAYVGGSGEIQAGDWLFQNAFVDATLGQGVSGAEIIAASPGSLTLAHPAAATAADKPIAFLVRCAPANDS